jgi:hypothetical protein
MKFSASDSPGEFIEFALGTLDTDLDLRPDAHIYVGSKASWTIICDDLPQYEEGREDESEYNTD